MFLSSTSLQDRQPPAKTHKKKKGKKTANSQDQARIRRDMAGEATAAIGKVARDGQRRLFAQRHAAVGVEDALVPACSHT